MITLGSRADARPRSCRSPTRSTRARGIEIVEVPRGGRSTYHGPGQLVCYPILDLNVARPRPARLRARPRAGDRSRRWPRSGSRATRSSSRMPRGVWVDDRKIASIGVRCARWVTSHGFSLNADLDLGVYDLVRRLRPGRRPVHLDHRRDGPRRSRSTTLRGPVARALAESVRPRVLEPAGGVPWSELTRERPELDQGARAVGQHAASTSCARSCARAACTPCARRPTAPTSASAGAAARPRSRSWATSARAPAATARSPPAGRRGARIRWSRCGSPGPCRRWPAPRGGHLGRPRRSARQGRGATSPRRSARSGARAPECGIEVLVPDFLGFREEALRVVLDAAPDVFNHNIETAEHLYRRVRPKGDYRKALDLLDRAKDVWAELHPDRAADRDQERDHRRHGRVRRRHRRGDARPARRTASTWSPSASTSSRPRSTSSSTAG